MRNGNPFTTWSPFKRALTLARSKVNLNGFNYLLIIGSQIIWQSHLTNFERVTDLLLFQNFGHLPANAVIRLGWWSRLVFGHDLFVGLKQYSCYAEPHLLLEGRVQHAQTADVIPNLATTVYQIFWFSLLDQSRYFVQDVKISKW